MSEPFLFDNVCHCIMHYIMMMKRDEKSWMEESKIVSYFT